MLAPFLFLTLHKDILDFQVRNDSLLRNLKSLNNEVSVTSQHGIRMRIDLYITGIKLRVLEQIIRKRSIDFKNCVKVIQWWKDSRSLCGVGTTGYSFCHSFSLLYIIRLFLISIKEMTLLRNLKLWTTVKLNYKSTQRNLKNSQMCENINNTLLNNLRIKEVITWEIKIYLELNEKWKCSVSKFVKCQ